jgi:transposase-like protein
MDVMDELVLLPPPSKAEEQEETGNGQAVTKRRGRHSTKPKFTKIEKFQIFKMVDDGEMRISQAAKKFGFGASSYSNWRKKLGDEYSEWRADGQIAETPIKRGRNNGRSKAKAEKNTLATPVDRVRKLKEELIRLNDQEQEIQNRRQELRDQIADIVILEMK